MGNVIIVVSGEELWSNATRMCVFLGSKKVGCKSCALDGKSI